MVIGIAAGAVWVRFATPPFRLVAALVPGAVATSFLALPLAGLVHAGLSSLLPGVSDGLIARLGGAAVLGLPAMVLFGATVPALMREERAVAEESGDLLWISGVGNAVGYLLFIAVLHPLLSGGPLLAVVGCGALLAAWMAPSRGESLGVPLTVGVALAALLVVTWDEARFQIGATAESFAGVDEVEVFRWGGESATLVRSGPDDWISYNGHPSIYARRGGVVNSAEITSGVIPALAAPRTGRAAVLGLGTGLTAGAAARVFDTVDVVEINGAFLDLAPNLSEANLGVLTRSNVSVVVGDGRSHLVGQVGVYDAIVNSIPAPTYYAASKIYTLEFYQSVRRALRPDGVFATWLAPTEMSGPGLLTVLNTLGAVFETCDLWLLARGYYMSTCSVTDRARAYRTIGADEIDPDLEWVLAQALGPLRPSEYLATLRISDDVLREVYAPLTAPNTDDRPVLEFLVTRETATQGEDPIASDPRAFGIRPWPVDVSRPADAAAARAAAIGRSDDGLREFLMSDWIASDPALLQRLDSAWAQRR